MRIARLDRCGGAWGHGNDGCGGCVGNEKPAPMMERVGSDLSQVNSAPAGGSGFQAVASGSVRKPGTAKLKSGAQRHPPA